MAGMAASAFDEKIAAADAIVTPALSHKHGPTIRETEVSDEDRNDAAIPNDRDRDQGPWRAGNARAARAGRDAAWPRRNSREGRGRRREPSRRASASGHLSATQGC